MAREKQRHVQGIPGKIHSLLVDMLAESHSVVNIGQVRERAGLPGFRIDPYAVLPGRISVYAPGDSFLEPDRVSFVFTEWVQHGDKRRGRIAADRILTPLAPVALRCSGEDVLGQVRRLKSYSVLGLAYKPVLVTRITRVVDPQAQRWCEYHVGRKLSRIMAQLGFQEVEGIFFSNEQWPCLQRRYSVMRKREVLASDVEGRLNDPRYSSVERQLRRVRRLLVVSLRV